MSSSQSSKPSVFPPDYDSKLQPGTEVIHVTDKRLAACLIAVGIRLRKDPPYERIRLRDGSVRTTFHFLPSDDAGELNTTKLIEAWGRDLDFISENPLHPFTFAMCAIRNYQSILEHMKRDTPFVAFHTEWQGKPATLMVKEGSKKHRAAVRKGLKQV